MDKEQKDKLLLDNIDIIHYLIQKNLLKYRRFFDSYEDMVQEIVKDIYKGLDKYDITRNYGSYVGMIALNTCRTRVRRFNTSCWKNISLESDTKLSGHDNEVGEETIIDLYTDNSQEDKDRKEEEEKIINEFSGDITKCVMLGGQSRLEIGEKYNTTQYKIRNIIKKDFNKIKSEIEKGYV